MMISGWQILGLVFLYIFLWLTTESYSLELPYTKLNSDFWVLRNMDFRRRLIAGSLLGYLNQRYIESKFLVTYCPQSEDGD